MTGRWFPDDDEVTAWLQEWQRPAEPGDPIADQGDAAARENMLWFHGHATSGLIEGGVSSITVADWDVTDQTRGLARIMLAVQQAGVQQMCEHVNDLVPLVVNCDPPLVHCRRESCMDAIMNQLDELEPLWPNSCDHCGGEGFVLTPMGFTFGHYTVLAQVCDGCLMLLHLPVQP
jgi:hypothetical protein